MNKSEAKALYWSKISKEERSERAKKAAKAKWAKMTTKQRSDHAKRMLKLRYSPTSKDNNTTQ